MGALSAYQLLCHHCSTTAMRTLTALTRRLSQLQHTSNLQLQQPFLPPSEKRGKKQLTLLKGLNTQVFVTSVSLCGESGVVLEDPWPSF